MYASHVSVSIIFVVTSARAYGLNFLVLQELASLAAGKSPVSPLSKIEPVQRQVMQTVKDAGGARVSRVPSRDLSLEN